MRAWSRAISLDRVALVLSIHVNWAAVSTSVMCSKATCFVALPLVIREVVPGVRHLAIMANIESPSAVLEMREAQAAARAHGLEVDGRGEGSLTIETVYCLGHCAASPAALLDGEPIGRLDRAQLDAIVESARARPQ